MSNLVREIEIEIVEPNSSSVDATAAAASAAAAATSATAAATSATAAATSATAAANSATSAGTQATNAATSATAAATSATAAATSATNSSTSATAAATSATAAATSATNAATSATAATTNGAAQVALAEAQVALATTQANNAAASYDSFDDRYLGAKSSNPTLDNDGNALLTGALYFNTTAPAMRVYNGSAWVNMPFTAVGALLVANNLSDLASAATARTNLGVAIGTNVQAYSAELAAIAALSTTTYGRSVLTQADAAALQTLAGLVIGTNVQAQDAELAAIAGLTSAADKVPYFTGSGTAALADLTAYGRTLIALADAAALAGQLASQPINNPTVTNYTEAVVAIGNSSTAQTIALTNGTVQTCTLTGNCTFTMPTATAGKSFLLLLKTGAGAFTATFTGVKWSSGTAPTITATASKLDVVSFVADGVNWYGSISQNFTP